MTDHLSTSTDSHTEHSPRHGTIVFIIPAYKPGPRLVTLVAELVERGAGSLVVVDDGSGPVYGEYFDVIRRRSEVHLITHAINMGKGAALKTGMNHTLVHFPDCSGAVTVDADGQHHPDDVMRVAQKLRDNPGALVLGVRRFSHDVPLRSRIGNRLTQVLVRIVIGRNISDTQTGLRGIPQELFPILLRTTASGYEFELDMLMACKYQSRAICEEPIRTIYLEGNRTSHFHPVLDSMRIYFLLFRFSVSSLLTAALDNGIFVAAFGTTHSIAKSHVMARSVAMVFNYVSARSVVFRSTQKHATVLPKYISLVLINGVLAYALLTLLHATVGVSPVVAKLIAETVLFGATFVIQRDLVFTRRRIPRLVTDWDDYYKAVPVTAHMTRKYTTRVLLQAIHRYGCDKDRQRGISIIEIGGANSCFIDAVFRHIRPESYEVIDTNAYGLTLLSERMGGTTPVRLRRQSVLDIEPGGKADLVFSVGLIEHSSAEGTREAILRHFYAVRPGGIAIITFPTPTPLYRAGRRTLEALGLWKFHDERPLRREEVLPILMDCGELLYETTLWPLVLTQKMLVVRKSTGNACVHPASAR